MMLGRSDGCHRIVEKSREGVDRGYGQKRSQRPGGGPAAGAHNWVSLSDC